MVPTFPIQKKINYLAVSRVIFTLMTSRFEKFLSKGRGQCVDLLNVYNSFSGIFKLDQRFLKWLLYGPVCWTNRIGFKPFFHLGNPFAHFFCEHNFTQRAKVCKNDFHFIALVNILFNVFNSCSCFVGWWWTEVCFTTILNAPRSLNHRFQVFYLFSGK